MNKVSNEEIFIIRRLIEGDEKAFKYFFDTYYVDLCNFVNAYVRDEDLSEDIVQNTFVYLWENRESLKYNSSVKAYLYASSKNKSLNHLRNSKNRNRIESEMTVSVEQHFDSHNFLEYKDLKDLIVNAIDRLPGKCKKIYQLSRDQGLSNNEIASQLDLSVKTVENQITIAIRKIKDFLKPYHDQIIIFFLLANFF